MKHQEKKITGGIYLVVDPAMNTSELLAKLQQAITGGLRTIQIWDRWQAGANNLSSQGIGPRAANPGVDQQQLGTAHGV